MGLRRKLNHHAKAKIRQPTAKTTQGRTAAERVNEGPRTVGAVTGVPALAASRSVADNAALPSWSPGSGSSASPDAILTPAAVTSVP